jgi:signal transduction histidine kinase
MRERQQAAVAKLGQKGLMGSDQELLMEEAVELVAETLDVEYCRIMKHEKDGNQLMVASVGWDNEKETEISNGASDQNIFCYTLYSGESSVSETNAKKKNINAFSLLKDHGMVSGMDVLIGSRDNPFGSMNVHTTQQRLFTEDDIHFIQSIANVLAESISRKESEENLKHYAQELEKTTELKVLFTDILTHDLLNPANIIRGFTEELLILENDKDKIPLLEKIHKNNERLISMMESASKFIKLESVEDIKYDEQDIVPMVQRAVREYEHEAKKKGVTLELRPVCKCNTIVSPLIEEVFLNLISNAIKYSPANEKVIVSVNDFGGECRVQVTDFGPGISSKDKPMIFERFRQADKGSVKGSGLGLAIVKRIMDLHNGKLGIDDNPVGKGSIFWVSVKKAN